ncbi:MAG: hypothetical protein ABGY42_05855 [bacterium]
MNEHVGIDRIGVYVPADVLAAETLAEARHTPVAKLKSGLGIHEIAVVPPWEDTVSPDENFGIGTWLLPDLPIIPNPSMDFHAGSSRRCSS